VEQWKYTAACMPSSVNASAYVTASSSSGGDRSSAKPLLGGSVGPTVGSARTAKTGVRSVNYCLCRCLPATNGQWLAVSVVTIYVIVVQLHDTLSRARLAKGLTTMKIKRSRLAACCVGHTKKNIRRNKNWIVKEIYTILLKARYCSPIITYFI